MGSTKKDIFNQLQKSILRLQGNGASPAGAVIDLGLGFMRDSFPNACFPLAAVHEFLSASAESKAATTGFITGLLGTLMQKGRACIWISKSRTLFPPALKAFGIEPDRIIFIDLQRQKDLLWAMEEALKCNGVAAVIGEMQEISFTDSRRLQLAVEQSRVTGFIVRHQPRNVNPVACVSRWKITPVASESEYDMPGVGFPRWNIELLKIRNGRPGSWQVEWSLNGLQHINKTVPALVQEQKRKAG